MNKKVFSFVLIWILLLNSKLIYAHIEPNDIDDTAQYQTLDKLKKELKDERKKIDQQRLEEIRLKEEEKKKNNETEIMNENKIDDNAKDNKNKSKTEFLPKLVVRLRGKHSSKYLCSYKFVLEDSNTEKVLENTIFTDYKLLLKKQSLKVRANEIINFQFEETPKKMVVFIWEDEPKELSVKRGSIKVPDIEGKVVIGIDGEYKNGNIRYAIVLDVRK